MQDRGRGEGGCEGLLESLTGYTGPKMRLWHT